MNVIVKITLNGEKSLTLHQKYNCQDKHPTLLQNLHKVVIFTPKVFIFIVSLNLVLFLCLLLLFNFTFFHFLLKIYQFFFLPLFKIWYIQITSSNKVLMDSTLDLTILLLLVQISMLAQELRVNRYHLNYYIDILTNITNFTLTLLKKYFLRRF